MFVKCSGFFIKFGFFINRLVTDIGTSLINNLNMKTFLQTLLFACLSISGFSQNFGIQFDGTANGSIVLCDSDDFNIGDGFTVEAWIFAAEWKAEAWQGSIVTKDEQNPDAGFAFRAGKNGTLSFVMSVDQAWFEVQSDPIMNTNQWYHIASVVDNGALSLFINGALVNSGSFSGSPTHNDQPLSIGKSWFPGRGWNGIIDEIRVWNVARTGAQIADNQLTAFTGSEAGLVTYLPMNEGTSTMTSNLVNSDCDGDLVDLGNDVWQDGYSIPAIDAGVVSIDAPDVLSIFNRPVKVRVTLQNYGSESISNIPVELDVNGLPRLSDTYVGTIQPGGSASFTFSTPLNLKGNNTNLLNAKTNHPDDDNALNNSEAYRYKKPDVDGNSQILTILNEEQHNFGSAGQSRFTPVNMPIHMEDFDQLLLHFSVECPSTGCDPWDQTANFVVVREDGEHEMARFVTPYGIECGDWTVDVTDFKTKLAGNITIKSFIQVFGQSGWLLNAELEFIKNAQPAYQKVTPLWETSYWVYGEPTVSHDLDPQTNTIASNTQNAHMRMTITGHGQGNTENAAEFSNKTHEIMVNDALAGTHNLWKDDCGQNSCSNQGGNWTPSRAGWCPGQEVTPFIFDLNDAATPGEALTLDYELEDYVNLLNTGYNDGSHTEPHYRIYGYLVEGSESHFADLNNLRAESILVETNGNPASPVFENITFEIKNTGTADISGAMATYYINDVFVVSEVISETIAAGATYVHEFTTVSGFEVGEDNDIMAIVTSMNDENISDDGVEVTINDDLTDVNEINPTTINIFPNPSDKVFNLQLSDNLLNGTVEVIDATGRVLNTVIINSSMTKIDIVENGLYLLRLTNKEGQTFFEKVVVQ